MPNANANHLHLGGNMKKIIIFLLLIGISIVFTACNSNINSNTIVASTYPAYDLTKRIVGDRFVVSQFVPNGQEPHDYEPTAKKIGALYDAKLYVEIGFGFEIYTNSLPKEIKDKTLTLSDGITPLYSHHSHHHDEEHDHDEEAETVNPHIWLSIKNAIKMMEAICQKMVEIDGENKDYYESNFNISSEQFKALDKKYEETLASRTSSYIATTHEAFGYLCNDYGLEEIAIMGITNADSPTASELAKITDELKEKKIKVIFGEEGDSSSFADTIALSLKIKKSSLNTIESLNNNTKDEDYLSLMEANLAKLKEALCNE